MFFHAEGAGSPVVLVHGLAQDHHSWLRQQEALSANRTIAYDLRGHGRSSLGDARGELGQLGEDLLALLEEVTGPAVCVGHSLGGTVVLWAAAHRPELVRAVVASGTSSVVGRAAADYYRERVEMVQSGRLDDLARALRTDTEAMIVDRSMVDLDAVVEERLRAIGDGRGYANAAMAMARMRERPLQQELVNVRCRVLLLVGEQDQFCPPRAVDIMLEALPAAAVVQIKGAGHLLNLERPRAYSEAVGKFVSLLGT